MRPCTTAVYTRCTSCFLNILTSAIFARSDNANSISPLVSLWKGFAKPLAGVAMAAVALGSLFHYVMKGPNEISKELEDEMEKEDAK